MAGTAKLDAIVFFSQYYLMYLYDWLILKEDADSLLDEETPAT